VRDLIPVAMHADGKAEASASVGDAVDEEADHPKGKLTFSFVCIDYARCVDAFQVVLPRGTALPCTAQRAGLRAGTPRGVCIAARPVNTRFARFPRRFRFLHGSVSPTMMD